MTTALASAPEPTTKIPKGIAERRKPAHLVLMVGMGIHVQHLMRTLPQRFGTTHSCFALDDSRPMSPEDIAKQVTCLADILDGLNSDEATHIVFCTGVPWSEPFVDALIAKLGERVSIVLVETDAALLEKELHLSGKEKREFRHTASRMLKRLDALSRAVRAKHRHPQDTVIYVEHRRTISRQAEWMHYKIALKTGHRIPAIS